MTTNSFVPSSSFEIIKDLIASSVAIPPVFLIICAGKHRDVPRWQHWEFALDLVFAYSSFAFSSFSVSAILFLHHRTRSGQR
jgi:hypothetical protein